MLRSIVTYSLFLGPSVFKLMFTYDLLEAPVVGLHVYSISLAGLAKLFPVDTYLWLRSGDMGRDLPGSPFTCCYTP